MKDHIIGLTNTYCKRIYTQTKKARIWVYRFTSKRPFASLFVLLGILLILIIVGNILNRPKETQEETKAQVKKVSVYHIGTAPTMTVQAQVEKSGVVTITALSPGVVQQIYVVPGDTVQKGRTLISTSSNYQGGNAAWLQVQIAKSALDNINDTYDTQKDIIAKQKDITSKVDSNNDEFRSIADKSLQETRNLISLNDSILSTLRTNLTTYETAGDATNTLYTKQSISSYTSANNSLRNALRNNEYSSAGDKNPAQISDLTREISIKQLELQEKAIDLNRDVTRIQYQISQVQAAAMYPSSPFNATVQRVLVKMGEAVSPGTPLVILSQEIEEDPIVAVAYVTREIAMQTSYAQPSVLTLGDISYESYPSYVSRDAVQGTLYGIFYPIPDSYHGHVTENGYINVKIPVGQAETSAAVPFVPLDAVYQTQEEAYVFIAEKGKAVAKKLTLGPVTGRYVEVKSGLKSGDIVILNRTVVGGDSVNY